MAERVAPLERELIERMAQEGYGDRLELQRFADLRYAGQAHEITTPLESGAPDFERLARAFGHEHERTYGHQAEQEEVESVALRVVARAPRDQRPGKTLRRDVCRTPAARDAHFG